MADFYVNYGSKGAVLIGSYKLGKVNIKLHSTKDHLYIVSKDRKIMFKSMDLDRSIIYFRSFIYMETPDSLFNS